MAKKYELGTIKLSNESNMLIYPKATQTDLNVMACILSKASRECNKDNYCIDLSKKELLRCLNWSASTEKRHWSDSDFKKYIDEHFANVALSIIYKKKTEKTVGHFVLFQGIEYAKDFDQYDEEQAVIKIRLGDDANKMIFSLGKNNPFYKYRLVDYIKIKSTYAKRMYQFLMQWRKVGKFEISFEDFKNYLDIPKSYNPRNIHRIMKPIEEDLSPMFENFKITRINNKNKNNKLVGFRFTWNPSSFSETDEEKNSLDGCGVTYKKPTEWPALSEETETDEDIIAPLTKEELDRIYEERIKKR